MKAIACIGLFFGVMTAALPPLDWRTYAGILIAVYFAFELGKLSALAAGRERES